MYRKLENFDINYKLQFHVSTVIIFDLQQNTEALFRLGTIIVYTIIKIKKIQKFFL